MHFFDTFLMAIWASMPLAAIAVPLTEGSSLEKRAPLPDPDYGIHDAYLPLGDYSDNFSPVSFDDDAKLPSTDFWDGERGLKLHRFFGITRS